MRRSRPPSKQKGAAGEATPRRLSDESNLLANDTHGNSADRKLIRSRGELMLYELTEGRAKSYEIVSPIGECWRFSLRYQAESKWARLLAKTKGGAR
jgi:hypothetical protein